MIHHAERLNICKAHVAFHIRDFHAVSPLPDPYDDIPGVLPPHTFSLIFQRHPAI